MTGQVETVIEQECWRCFFCDEVFFDRDKAAQHFGDGEMSEPACLIDIEEFRRMEQLVERYRNEDSDNDREISRLRSEIERTKRKWEEIGYQRGLDDARKHPETLGLRRVNNDEA